MIANRSPPTPVFIGSTRLSTAAVATAASIALPPFIMICSPACAASGWLVVTMPWVAMTSARLWAAQPSARSPRTAAQAGAGGCVLQTAIGGPALASAWARSCAHACDEAVSATTAPMTARARMVAFPMAFSRAAASLVAQLAVVAAASRRRSAKTSLIYQPTAQRPAALNHVDVVPQQLRCLRQRLRLQCAEIFQCRAWRQFETSATALCGDNDGGSVEPELTDDEIVRVLRFQIEPSQLLLRKVAQVQRDDHVGVAVDRGCENVTVVAIG